MPDDLLRYRSEFPILERTNYMISNSLGAVAQEFVWHEANCNPGTAFRSSLSNRGTCLIGVSLWDGFAGFLGPRAFVPTQVQCRN